jgi:hypothetical protein
METTNDAGEKQAIYPRGKYDSAIVPVDARSNSSGKPWRNLILDDELSELFSAFTAKGTQVVFVSDSCHSGTIARAKQTDAQVRTIPLTAVFGTRTFAEIKFEKPARVRSSFDVSSFHSLYIVLTGSRDDEFSLDARIHGVPVGLFTSTLISDLNGETKRDLTYSQLMGRVSGEVAKVALTMQNDQNPQLDSRFGNANSIIFAPPTMPRGVTK